MNRPIFQQLDRTASRPYTGREYLARLLWRCVQCVLIRPSPARAFGWRRFWLRTFGATMAPHSGTRPTTRVMHPWLLEVGDWSILGEHVQVYNLGQVKLGEHTVVSHGVHLCAGTHDYTQANLPLVRSTITLGSGVWVCTEAFIGPGVTVGDNAIVAARAVVVGDVEPATIVGGNPARFIKPRPLGDAHDATATV